MSSESKSHTQLALLKKRRFAPLFITQFLGAINDNLFTSAMLVLLTAHATPWTVIAPELATNLAVVMFVPVFLFSAIAGQLADKYDKAKLARRLKVLEMVVMGLAMLGLFMGELPVLLATLFLLGVRATIFSPVKYAILPQHLRQQELVGGNGLVVAGTFVAILAGAVAGDLVAWKGWHAEWIAFAGLIFAATGFLSSCAIPPAPAPDPGLRIGVNPVSESWRNVGLARRNQSVFLSILGISWFWLYVAMSFLQLLAYAKNVLGGDNSSVALLLGIFVVGIGLGSMLCEKLSDQHIEIGVTHFGAMGLAVFGFDLAFASTILPPPGAPYGIMSLLGLRAIWHMLFDLFALGVFGGFFVVPLYALMQSRSEPQYRGRIIAANNFLNALFVVLGALVAAGLFGDEVTIPEWFGFGAVCNAGVAIYIYRMVPHLLLRFLAWMLIQSVYRLERSGLEHIPDQGPAVLVCNHVSFIDAVVLMAAVRRPIRFVMDHRIYRTPVIGFLFRHSRTIPIATAKVDPVQKEAAFREVARALGEGELIGLFPEGKITHTGELNHFRYGVGRIVAETPVPVIPIALRGLWGSFFSRRYGPAMSKPSLLRLFSKIGLVADEPVAPEMVTPEYLKERVAALLGESG